MFKCDDTTSCRYIYPMNGKLTSENFGDLNGSSSSQSIASQISSSDHNYWAKFPEDSNRKIEETWYRLGFSNGSITPKIWTATFKPNKFDIVTLLSQEDTQAAKPSKITTNVNKYVIGQVFFPASATGGTLEIKTDDGFYAPVEIYYIEPGSVLDDNKVSAIINDTQYNYLKSVNGRFSQQSTQSGKWYYIKFKNGCEPITVTTTFSFDPDVIPPPGFYYNETELPLESTKLSNPNLIANNMLCVKDVVLSIIRSQSTTLTKYTGHPLTNLKKKVVAVLAYIDNAGSYAGDDTYAFRTSSGPGLGEINVIFTKPMIRSATTGYSYLTADKSQLWGCIIAHEIGHSLDKTAYTTPTGSQTDSIMQETLELIDRAIERHRGVGQHDWLPQFLE